MVQIKKEPAFFRNKKRGNTQTGKSSFINYSIYKKTKFLSKNKYYKI